MKFKFYLLYKAKKWDFFFPTLCLFLENVFINRHFCLFYRFLDTFILICLLLYKKYISIYFSTRCLLFSDLISPVGKIAQKLDPQIVQHAKTNKKQQESVDEQLKRVYSKKRQEDNR